MAHPLAGEVIVVNNASSPLAWESPRVLVLQQDANIYVNAAGNLGVREFAFPLLAILHDDILFASSLLDHVARYLTVLGVEMIGGGPSAS